MRTLPTTAVVLLMLGVSTITQGAALLSRHYQDHPELAVGGAEQAMNDFNIIRVAVDADVEHRVRPVLDRYEGQLAGQRRIVAAFRLFAGRRSSATPCCRPFHTVMSRRRRSCPGSREASA